MFPVTCPLSNCRGQVAVMGNGHAATAIDHPLPSIPSKKAALKRIALPRHRPNRHQKNHVAPSRNKYRAKCRYEADFDTPLNSPVNRQNHTDCPITIPNDYHHAKCCVLGSYNNQPNTAKIQVR